MSLRFNNRRRFRVARSSLRQAGVAVGIAMLCHGCGTSGSVRPADESAAEAEMVLEIIVSPATRAAYERALEAMDGDDSAEAELRFKQFILEYPDFPGAYVNLAIVYERDGRYEDAHNALDRALALEPAHATASNRLGILLRKQGKFAEAEQAYLRAIDSDPAYALAHHNLGVLLDLYLYRPAEALEHYRRYQDLLVEPDAAVGRWIIDLERRVGVVEEAPRVAQEDGV